MNSLVQRIAQANTLTGEVFIRIAQANTLTGEVFIRLNSVSPKGPPRLDPRRSGSDYQFESNL